MISFDVLFPYTNYTTPQNRRQVQFAQKLHLKHVRFKVKTIAKARTHCG